jgi:hypothetical protein
LRLKQIDKEKWETDVLKNARSYAKQKDMDKSRRRKGMTLKATEIKLH